MLHEHINQLDIDEQLEFQLLAERGMEPEEIHRIVRDKFTPIRKEILRELIRRRREDQ